MNAVKPPLFIFAYSFAHRKTHDFLLECAAAGYRQVSVLAAPWVELGYRDDNNYFPRTLQDVPPRPAKDLCHAFGFAYLERPHDDLAGIRAFRESSEARMGVIAGARILKRGVIDLFADGVVNFHPGKLPETAGLDAFYQSLEQDIPVGVTAHLIDSRIDAGRQLFFEETPIGPGDSPEAVLHNNYQTQIEALRRFLELVDRGELSSVAIDRPFRNLPLQPAQKRAALGRFAEWRQARHTTQQEARLLLACKAGDLALTAKLLAESPALISCRSPEGWTPLIVAAFHQRRQMVSLLLDHGADPNEAGTNGTTPLMYGKTALLHSESADYELLEVLLKAGADLRRQDRHGKDIFDYVSAAGDARLLEWLQRKSERP
jgi:phosphoribosylglycinamide formyltransferase-1